jgi:hypothetical protein
MTKQYQIDITMPSGEKLPTVHVDQDAFVVTHPAEVGAAIASTIMRLIDQRLKQ